MNSVEDFDEQTNPFTASSPASPSTKIPVLEERLIVGVEQVETGVVQVQKRIISQEISQEVPVTHDEIEVKHVPLNQYVEHAPAIRYDGDSTIISVVKEVLVVEKRLMLVEEIHLIKKQILSTATVKETLRKEEVVVSRADTNSNSLKQ